MEVDMNAMFRNTWIAVGGKVGGQLVFVGAEGTLGSIANLYNRHWRYNFEIDSLRWGPRVGVSGGLCAVFVFNCQSLSQIDQTSIEDWGFNCAIAGRWAQICKTLANFKFYATLAKIGTSLAIGIEDAEKLKLSVNYLWNALDMSKRGGAPTIVSIDTPIGTGLELSLVKIYGKFYLQENCSIQTPRN